MNIPSRRLNRRNVLGGFGGLGLAAAIGLRSEVAGAAPATPRALGRSACTGDPHVGDIYALKGPEGTQVATMTLADYTDPYQAYAPGSPPDTGFRFVVATVQVSVTGQVPRTVDPSWFRLQDTDGVLYRTASLRLPEGATDVLFQRSDLTVGSQGSGLVAFQVLRDATPARWFYLPDDSHLDMIADLRS